MEIAISGSPEKADAAIKLNAAAHAANIVCLRQSCIASHTSRRMQPSYLPVAAAPREGRSGWQATMQMISVRIHQSSHHDCDVVITSWVQEIQRLTCTASDSHQVLAVLQARKRGSTSLKPYMLCGHKSYGRCGPAICRTLIASWRVRSAATSSATLHASVRPSPRGRLARARPKSR